MSNRRWAPAVVFGGVVVGVCLWAAPAGADVVSPPGACSGTGQWSRAGLDETTAEHSPSDVIVIPKADDVAWTGTVGGAAPGDTGPERPISGEIVLDLPLASVTLGDWNSDSELYGDADTYDYKLPSVLVGVEMLLHGTHSENGQEVCSGEVILRIDGDTFENPMTFVGIAGSVVSFAVLLLAGRAVVVPV